MLAVTHYIWDHVTFYPAQGPHCVFLTLSLLHCVLRYFAKVSEAIRTNSAALHLCLSQWVTRL
jgi:hypothetical protein